ncbi:MAG: tetratricopeptide repeat protein, partial [Cyanobacteria bacterium J06555_13]
MNHALKLMLLCGLAPALVSGLSARALAQMAEQPPLLQVEGTLQADDETLSDGRFYDVHEFTGKADQAVTLLLESEAFDPTLALVDDQGNIIATNNDISSENANAALLTVLPATGRYRVIANAAQAETTQGPYRLAIHSTPASGPNPLLSGVEVTLLEAEQLFQSGLEYYQRSELRDALSLWEEALSRFRDYEVRVAFLQDSRQGEAKALISLGIAYLALGDYERAIDFQQQALDLTRQLGNRQGEANALGNLGIAYLALGDHERTIGFMQQALDLTRQLGNRQGEAN